MNIEEKLLKECAKNNRKAQKELYEICFILFMPMCKRYHINESDARSSFNLAFLKIVDNLSKLDKGAQYFIPWAKRITTNTLIDEYRKHKRYQDKIQKKEKDREIEIHGSPNENIASKSFDEKSVLLLLDELKPTTKQVFVLYVIEGYSHKEIGEMLDMSNGTSKWHLSVARKELKELYLKRRKLLAEKFAI